MVTSSDHGSFTMATYMCIPCKLIVCTVRIVVKTVLQIFMSVKAEGQNAGSFILRYLRVIRNICSDTVVRRLTTGIRSKKCVVRRFRRCANVTECTYTNLDNIA